ncbi:uncharacterized protein BDW43DRAFT_319392 [Aspergillus alliaceus]|uniref:uncharacterized protein n=1 Tax=Petromyces alliaceus TaxID=209559 RepID=UPI0012A3C82E|nr:uncharacterized protein BDW43DRAFT_319392 [Aspergillus alliaceus]KAB8239144.1 hypothetical protein BDW43DRAFT_319392 [Aspergillus alliaceus]
MGQQRYFFLDEAIPASEMDSFIFEHFHPLTSGCPSHKTEEIIPDILPQPSLSTNRKEPIQVFREKDISAQLSALLGFKITRGSSETRKLGSDLVNTMPGDVRALLESAKFHRIYLVTGFLTASRMLDFGLQPRVCSGAQHSRELFSEGEEIIAASYSVVKLKHQGRPLPGFDTKAPVLGRPKRAKAYHLALGHDEENFEFGDKGAPSVGALHLPSETVSYFEL